MNKCGLEEGDGQGKRDEEDRRPPGWKDSGKSDMKYV